MGWVVWCGRSVTADAVGKEHRLRASPTTTGKPVRVIAYQGAVEVGMVKTDGDVETVREDHRRLWLASGEGFAWAGNVKKEE